MLNSTVPFYLPNVKQRHSQPNDMRVPVIPGACKCVLAPVDLFYDDCRGDLVTYRVGREAGRVIPGDHKFCAISFGRSVLWAGNSPPPADL